MKTFDSETHIYRDDGARRPGATDIIKAENLIKSEWMSEESRWRGKCVHRGVELLNKNELDWDTVDGMVAGYLRSYEQFIELTKFTVVGAERPCFDIAFACLPDIWGSLNGVNVVIELKTGVVPKWAAIQTALQKIALKKDLGFNAVKRFGLRLMADGTVSKLVPFDNPGDEYVAMGMVSTFWWKVAHGLIDDWSK